MVARRPRNPSSSSQVQAEPILDSLGNAYERLGRLERHLEHSHRLATIGTLTAGVAHEINNLLTPVLGYAYLARKRGCDSTAVDKALDRIIQGVESTARIVQAILGFAAPDRVSAETSDVRAAAQAALECMARNPQKDAITTTLLIDGDVAVRMSPISLQQVLLNLILNACRAMRPRGGELMIQAASGKDGTTLITVADTGPGLPPDVLSRIFMPFPGSHPRVPSAGPTPPDPSISGSAGSGSGGTNSVGTGLGLFICRQLVESAGGSITAMNGPTGAIFTIMLHTAAESGKKTA